MEADPNAKVFIFNPALKPADMVKNGNPHGFVYSTFRLSNVTTDSEYTLTSIAQQLHHWRIDVLRIDLQKTDYKLVKLIINDPNKPIITQISLSIHKPTAVSGASLDLIALFTALDAKDYEIANIEFNPDMPSPTSCFWEVLLVKKLTGMLVV